MPRPLQPVTRRQPWGGSVPFPTPAPVPRPVHLARQPPKHSPVFWLLQGRAFVTRPFRETPPSLVRVGALVARGQDGRELRRLVPGQTLFEQSRAATTWRRGALPPAPNASATVTAPTAPTARIL